MHLVCSAAAAAFALHFLPAVSSAQCAEWSPGFSTPGANGSVEAAVVFDDGSGPALFVGGAFDQIGGARARRLAKWNGSSFSEVGGGLSTAGLESVLALATFDDGSGPALYVGGRFTSAGGQPIATLARWDGASRSAVGGSAFTLTLFGTSTTPSVSALAVHDDGSGPALFATGAFETVGGTTVNSIAKWDGASWAPLGLGLSGPNGLGGPRALASFGGELYAAGNFSGANLPPGMIGLGRWNGSQWQPVGLGTGNFSSVRALEVFDDGSGPALYVGGFLALLDGTLTDGLTRWNGASFSAVAPGQLNLASQGAFELEVFDDGSGPRLYIGGLGSSSGAAFGGLFSYDGVSVRDEGLVGSSQEPPPAHLLASFDSGSGPRLFVGATFDPSVYGLEHFARRDGIGAYSLVGTADLGLDGSARALATTQAGPDGGPALYASGAFTRAGATTVQNIARFDGLAWSALGGGLNGEAYALLVFDDGAGPKLFAGGDFTLAGGVSASRIASWDGAAWSPLGAGMNGIVRSLASFDDGSGAALYAGGEFTLAGGATVNHIAKWNGASWSAVGGGVTNPTDPCTVDALLVHDDGSGPALYLGGNFRFAGGAPADRIARWNGASWSNVGVLGFNNYVSALALHDAGQGLQLYAAGAFQSVDGVAAPRVARWNGVAWSSVGAGLPTRVLSLHSHDDGRGRKLYAGDRDSVDVFDGVAWSSIGEASIFDEVRALATFADGLGGLPALYCGGGFDRMGAVGSDGIARYSDPCVCQGQSYCTAGTSSSGCVAQISSSGAALVGASSGFTLSVSGVEGARSGQFFYGVSGALSTPWSPTSTSLLCVRPPLQRMPVQNTGGSAGNCDGAASIDWSAYAAANPGSLGAPFTAGARVWAQFVYRDPSASRGRSLSDALAFTICP